MALPATAPALPAVSREFSFARFGVAAGGVTPGAILAGALGVIRNEGGAARDAVFLSESKSCLAAGFCAGIFFCNTSEIVFSLFFFFLCAGATAPPPHHHPTNMFFFFFFFFINWGGGAVSGADRPKFSVGP